MNTAPPRQSQLDGQDAAPPRRMLISTIAARDGGVPAMLRFALEVVRRSGWQPVLAYYEPYSWSPGLSVPGFRLGTRRPGERRERHVVGCEAVAMGAWLPELEFTHYWPRRRWRELLQGFDGCLVVSGNALAGVAMAFENRPFVAWLATDFDGDRDARVARFAWPRRMLDRLLNARVARWLERRVLRASHVLALSEHTRAKLDRRAGRPVVRAALPAPVDCVRLQPAPERTEPGLVGFLARLDDPRKNVALLLRAIRHAGQLGVRLRLELVGAGADGVLRAQVSELGLDAQVRVLPQIDPAHVGDYLQRWDVFALPSHQEGLCIAALEAMACGVPVVSTRCGGPEEFVRDGSNGRLVGFGHEEFAQALIAVTADRGQRAAMAGAARTTVQEHYSTERAGAILAQALEQVFPSSSRSLSS